MRSDGATHDRGTTPKFDREALVEQIANLEAEHGAGARVVVTGATPQQMRSTNAELARRGLATRVRRG